MKWTDSQQIGETLYDTHPEIDPKTIAFTRLRELILNLPEFNDNPDHCGERILEAIQQIWINESE